jgi:hypothetical protein
MCVHVGVLLLPLFFLNGRKIAKGSKTITLNNKQMTINTSTNHDEKEQDHGLLTQGGGGEGMGGDHLNKMMNTNATCPSFLLGAIFL